MKLLLLIAAVVLLAALIGKRPVVRRVFSVILGLIVLYAVLKVTGVIEAIAPSRGSN